MLDRIVPVHRTDLMSLYYLILALKNTGLTWWDPVAPGVFDLSDGDGDVAFLIEPAKTIKYGNVEGCYFVPAFDFEGCTDENGNALELTGNVVADGKSLHYLHESDGVYQVEPFYSLSADHIEGSEG